MKSRLKQTDAFKVKTELGNIYEIMEITYQTYQAPFNPAINGWVDDFKEYKVVGGGNANRKSDTDYEIVSTGEIAVRV